MPFVQKGKRVFSRTLQGGPSDMHISKDCGKSHRTDIGAFSAKKKLRSVSMGIHPRDECARLGNSSDVFLELGDLYWIKDCRILV